MFSATLSVHMSELEATVQNTQNGPVVAQTSRRLSKAHQDRWYSRLGKRTYRDRRGKEIEVPDWQVRLAKDRRRHWFNLGTPNRVAAAIKAREIHTFLKANGWEPTLAKYKPDGNGPSNNKLTVGDFLRAV